MFVLVASIAPLVAQLQFETVKALATDGSEGAGPSGPLAQTPDGWIYGLTNNATTARAVAFRFHPSDPAGTFTAFWPVVAQGANSGINPADVGNGGLVLAGDGNLYGVVRDSTCGYYGSVIRITPPTTVTTIAAVCDLGVSWTAYGLTVGPDGALYGTAHIGGANGVGGVYRVTLNGVLSLVASFPSGFPYGTSTNLSQALVSGSEGRLYGTMNDQFYRVDLGTGSIAVLDQFTNIAEGYGTLGRLVEVPPLPGHDLAFAGVTEHGGGYASQGFDGGVVYRIDVSGSTATRSKLHDFGCDGYKPKAGLIRDELGNLYGTTSTGCPETGATSGIYRVTSDGVFSWVQSFGSNSVWSSAPLLFASDRNLYGTTEQNSSGPPPVTAAGSIFRVRLHGKAAQAPLSVADAPASAAYGSSFSVTTSGGSGTGSVTFAVTGSCQNDTGGDVITMTGSTGICFITATKAGDDNFDPTTSPAASVDATKASASVTPSAAGKVYGSPDPPLTGAVTGFLPSDNVTATYSRAAGESVGIYTISASLEPAGALGNYNITYNTAAFTITPAATSTTLTSSPNPSTAGQTVTLTATVSSTAGTPSGTVTFNDGATVLGTVSLTNGVATLTTGALATGSHSLTVIYSGSNNFSTSASAPLPHVVGQVATSTSLSSSANPSVFGQVVTLTATVSSTTGMPSGTVSFKDGNKTLGTATLSGGTASLNVSPGAGSHTLTAVYGGSESYRDPRRAVNVSQATAACS